MNIQQFRDYVDFETVNNTFNYTDALRNFILLQRLVLSKVNYSELEKELRNFNDLNEMEKNLEG